MRTIAEAALGVTLLVLGASGAAAQDLEPKAYSASPVGANFLVGSYTWSSGAVVLDPTLPISDVAATVNGAAIAIGHSFGLFGDLALATVALPYAWADVTGKIDEQAAATSRSGLADARVKLSVNLRGNPAMTPSEFAKAPRRAIVGASLLVQAPTGQYYPAKLINVGNNRWAFKPEVGLEVPIRRLEADIYARVWLFTSNASFYPGNLERTQDPVTAVQAHISYAFQPRLWIAFDSTWYSGGSARVAGGEPLTGVNNSRAGLTLSLPVGRRYSLKVAYASGVTVRTGTDFTTFAAAWQVLWLS